MRLYADDLDGSEPLQPNHTWKPRTKRRRRRRWTPAKTRRVLRVIGDAIYAAFVGLTLTAAVIGIFLLLQLAN